MQPQVNRSLAAEFLTTAEVCAALKITRSRVEQMRRDPSVKFPVAFQPVPKGKLLYKRSSIEQWIEQRQSQVARIEG